MEKNYFLYFLPFLIFFISHIFISEFIFKKEKIRVKNFTNKTIFEIIPFLQEFNISISFSKIHNQQNLKNGLIINQYPKENELIFKKSPIFLEINLLNLENKKKELILNNLNLNEAINILLENGFSYKIIEILSEKNNDKIQGSILKENCYFLYTLKKNKYLFIIENLKNCFCKNLKEKFKEYKLNFICLNQKNEIIDDDHNLKIISQQPISGKFIIPSQDIYLWH